MTVFSMVVTGVKRRGKVAPPEAGSSSQVTHQLRGENSQVTTVAPDLRRFSDFMNPFPTVSPGGYTKYYQAKSKAEPGSSQFALPPLCELNQRPPSRRPPAIQTSGLPKKHRSSRKGNSGSKTLESIPESDPHSAHSHEGRGLEDGLQGSLRRRKRRVLRTPSVERDFAQHALLDVHPTLGRAASTSSSSSTSTSGHSPNHSTSSDDSHNSSMQSSPSSEFPRTPVDNAPLLPRAYLFHDPFDQKGATMQHQDWEPFERPDSRSTYRTARTHFDDI